VKAFLTGSGTPTKNPHLRKPLVALRGPHVAAPDQETPHEEAAGEAEDLNGVPRRFSDAGHGAAGPGEVAAAARTPS